MSAFQDERKAIELHFSGNFTGVPLSRVKWQNVPFNQPSNQSWVALETLPGGGNQASIGDSPLYRYAGIIQVTIYTLPDTGTNASLVIADNVEAVFRSKQLSNGNSGTITTRTPFQTYLGVADGWDRRVISVAYQRDKIF